MFQTFAMGQAGNCWVGDLDSAGEGGKAVPNRKYTFLRGLMPPTGL